MPCIPYDPVFKPHGRAFLTYLRATGQWGEPLNVVKTEDDPVEAKRKVIDRRRQWNAVLDQL